MSYYIIALLSSCMQHEETKNTVSDDMSFVLCLIKTLQHTTLVSRTIKVFLSIYFLYTLYSNFPLHLTTMYRLNASDLKFHCFVFPKLLKGELLFSSLTVWWERFPWLQWAYFFNLHSTKI